MRGQDSPKIHSGPPIFTAEDPGAGAEALAMALRRSTAGTHSGLRFWIVVIVLSAMLLTLLVVQRHDAYAQLQAEEAQRKQSARVALPRDVKGKDLNHLRPTGGASHGHGGVEIGGHMVHGEAAAAVLGDGASDAEGVGAQGLHGQPSGPVAPLGLCVLVRTRESHHERLSHLVESLLISARQSPTLYVRILLMDTQQENPQFTANMEEYARDLTDRDRAADPHGNSTVSVLHPPRVAQQEDEAHGYEYTVWARDHLKSRRDCSYVLVTSGTSYYVSTFTLVLEPLLRRGALMVAFDYISHDREAWEASGTNVVSVKMRKGYVTIGAVILDHKLATETEDAFHAPAAKGRAPSVRDFHYVKRLSRAVPPEQTVMLHQALLVLQ